MAITRNDKAYGFNNGLQTLSPQPIIAQRAPTTADFAALMTLWDDKPNNQAYILTSVVNNLANWQKLEAGGTSGSFSSLTVTPGPTAITGQFTLTAGTNAVNFGADAADHAMNIGSTTGSSIFTIRGGSGASSIATTGGTFGLTTGTGTLSISADGSATTVNIGTGAAAKSVTLGSSTTTSSTAIHSGSTGTSVTSSGPIAITSTDNVGTAIVIEANGGTGEGVNLSSLQGTGVGGSASVLLESTVGGIGLIALGSTNASAIDLDAQAGGITTHSVLQTAIASEQAAISAIVLHASDNAGGVQIETGALAATTGLNLVQGAANASIQVGAGDPGHSAPKGTLYIKVDASTTTSRLWINTDAGTTWAFIITSA